MENRKARYVTLYHMVRPIQKDPCRNRGRLRYGPSLTRALVIFLKQGSVLVPQSSCPENPMEDLRAGCEKSRCVSLTPNTSPARKKKNVRSAFSIDSVEQSEMADYPLGTLKS